MKRNRKKLLLCLLLLLCGCMAAAISASAKPKYKNEWVRASSGYVYYYGENGKKVTGMQKIGEKYYFFDSKGRQRTGWKKIKDHYYYFRIGTKTKGYRLSSTTVNGIRLNAKGRAKLTKAAKRKLVILVKANKTMQRITTPKMSKKQKLKTVFEYTRKHLRAFSRGRFQGGGAWDVFYAEIPFNTRRADCYSYAAYFAYLANAIGYKASVVSSGGHGWAEIGGKVYDANWANVSKVDSYYGMSYNLSGVGGRPRYKWNRAYVRTI